MENKHIYEIIISELANISKCEVIFGFIEDYNIGKALPLDGKFIVIPNSISADTVSINHKKRYIRTIKINYIKPNNISDNSMADMIHIEQILEQLNNSPVLLRRIMNMDYSFDINLIKESGEITGLLNIEINLEIKER